MVWSQGLKVLAVQRQVERRIALRAHLFQPRRSASLHAEPIRQDCTGGAVRIARLASASASATRPRSAGGGTGEPSAVQMCHK